VINNVSEWRRLFGRINGREEREAENDSQCDAVHEGGLRLAGQRV